MSRSTAAATPYSDMHLSVQRSPTEEPTGVTVKSAPFGEPNPVDFGALVILSMLSRYSLLKNARRDEAGNSVEKVINEPGLDWHTGAFRNTRMDYNMWIESLSWLLDGHAFRLFLPMMARERFPTSNQERLEQLAIPLRRLESRVRMRMPSHLFAKKNYQRRFEIACLLDATLNADHAAIERLFEGKECAAIKAMLSTSGTAVIEHLGIERTGTPLQMALYSHDETAFKFLADQMDQEEVTRQCKKVFDACSVRNYGKLIEKQIRDANSLCGELEVAFIPNPLNRVSGTTSTLQDVLNRFKTNLDQYVRANPVHNPYILQRLFEIYDRLPGDRDNRLLISQHAIGLAQKLSSACWLQLNAQGVYYFDIENALELPRSSFVCRDSFPLVDIRSHGVLSCLGVDSCINIFGSLAGWPGALVPVTVIRGIWVDRPPLSRLISRKNNGLGQRMGRAAPQPTQQSTNHYSGCCAMM